MKVLKYVIATVAIFTIINLTVSAYAFDPFYKMGRGMINAATGWLELPSQIHKVSQERDPLVGITYGSGYGAWMSVVRTTTGALDTGFFFLPPYDKPMIQPEFII